MCRGRCGQRRLIERDRRMRDNVEDLRPRRGPRGAEAGVVSGVLSPRPAAAWAPASAIRHIGTRSRHRADERAQTCCEAQQPWRSATCHGDRQRGWRSWQRLRADVPATERTRRYTWAMHVLQLPSTLHFGSSHTDAGEGQQRGGTQCIFAELVGVSELFDFSRLSCEQGYLLSSAGYR